MPHTDPEKLKAYRVKNRDKINAQWRARYAKTRDRRLAVLRARRAENRDTYNAYQRAYRTKNRNRILDRDRAYYAKNQDKLLAQRRIYEASNRNRITAQRRMYEAANRDKLTTTHREWVAKNRDHLNAYKVIRRHRALELSRKRYKSKREHILELDSKRRHARGILPRDEYLRRKSNGEFREGLKTILDVPTVRVIKGLLAVGCGTGLLGILFNVHGGIIIAINKGHTWKWISVIPPEIEIRQAVVLLCRNDRVFLLRWMSLTLYLENRTYKAGKNIRKKDERYEKRSHFLEFCHSVCKAV